MNNDLISRKALIEVLQPMLEAECTSYIAGMILGKIKYFPTAYDIDNVIEKLESLKGPSQESWHAIDHAIVWSIEQSIEIVKKGGAE